MILFGEIVFGPVHSRRLGISLGVNLLPADGKVCTFDCIYCECGYNANRRTHTELPDRKAVYEALEKRLAAMKEAGEELNVITFAGNGEPTLHPQFPEIIDDTIKLRDTYFPEVKISVLSNAARIDDAGVFSALNRVDNNILKIDSVYDDTIRRINAPVAQRFSAEELIERLCRFNGKLIVQTLFLQGEHNGAVIDNTTDREVEGWIGAIRRIAPQKVMVYTIDRETPEKNLRKVLPEKLNEIARRVEALGIEVSVSC